jgi:hypothetical protein
VGFACNHGRYELPDGIGGHQAEPHTEMIGECLREIEFDPGCALLAGADVIRRRRIPCYNAQFTL